MLIWGSQRRGYNKLVEWEAQPTPHIVIRIGRGAKMKDIICMYRIKLPKKLQKEPFYSEKVEKFLNTRIKGAEILGLGEQSEGWK